MSMSMSVMCSSYSEALSRMRYVCWPWHAIWGRTPLLFNNATSGSVNLRS